MNDMVIEIKGIEEVQKFLDNTAKKVFDTGAFKNNPNHIKLKTFIEQRTSK